MSSERCSLAQLKMEANEVGSCNPGAEPQVYIHLGPDWACSTPSGSPNRRREHKQKRSFANPLCLNSWNGFRPVEPGCGGGGVMCPRTGRQRRCVSHKHRFMDVFSRFIGEEEEEDLPPQKSGHLQKEQLSVRLCVDQAFVWRLLWRRGREVEEESVGGRFIKSIFFSSIKTQLTIGGKHRFTDSL